MLAAREVDDQGDDASMRHIGALENFADSDQNEILSQIDGT